MKEQIYQVHISIVNSKPNIWRQVLLSSETTLIDFHRIIQTVMGWTNSHLHEFMHGRDRYAPEEFEVEGTNDSDKVKLSKILKKENQKITYEYDFGDGWMHDILLEKVMPYEETAELPSCTAGKGNCPPEDCGGIRGYENLRIIISNPKHEEYMEMIEWLGGKFDPDFFNMEEVNEMLKEDDYGCIWLH